MLASLLMLLRSPNSLMVCECHVSHQPVATLWVSCHRRSSVYFGMRTQSSSPVMVSLSFIRMAPAIQSRASRIGFACSQQPTPQPSPYNAKTCSLVYVVCDVVQTGIAWFPGQNLEAYRSSCKDSDKLKGWGWQRHDGRSYGQQVLEDPTAGVVCALSWTFSVFIVASG